MKQSLKKQNLTFYVISVDIKNHEEWIIRLFSFHISVDCRLYLNNLSLFNQKCSTFSIYHQN